MRIVILRAVRLDGVVHKPGELVAPHAPDARRAIASNKATPAPETASVEPAETATRKRGRPRKATAATVE